MISNILPVISPQLQFSEDIRVLFCWEVRVRGSQKWIQFPRSGFQVHSSRLAFLTLSNPCNSDECCPHRLPWLAHASPVPFLAYPLKLNHLNTCHFSWTFERLCLLCRVQGKHLISLPLLKLQLEAIILFSPLGLFCLAKAIEIASVLHFSCLLAKCVDTVVEFQWLGLF